MTPEAAAGGAIGKIRNGDVIRLDAPAGRLEVKVADDVWARRPHAEADLSAVPCRRRARIVLRLSRRGRLGGRGSGDFPSRSDAAEAGVEVSFIIGERNEPSSPDERGLLDVVAPLACCRIRSRLRPVAGPRRDGPDRGHARPGQDRQAAAGHDDAHHRQPDDRGRDHAQEQQCDGHYRQGLRADEPDRHRRRRIGRRGKAGPGPAGENRAGPAERDLQDLLRLQPRLHADGPARRRRQDVLGRRRSDLDPQRLRRGRRGTGRRNRRYGAAGRSSAASQASRKRVSPPPCASRDHQPALARDPRDGRGSTSPRRGRARVRSRRRPWRRGRESSAGRPPSAARIDASRWRR